MSIQTIEGILIPFLGTTLGAAMVFLLKNQISVTVQKALTGFAAGVMVAASFWSLLQPALDSSEKMGKLSRWINRTTVRTAASNARPR